MVLQLPCAARLKVAHSPFRVVQLDRLRRPDGVPAQVLKTVPRASLTDLRNTQPALSVSREPAMESVVSPEAKIRYYNSAVVVQQRLPRLVPLAPVFDLRA